MAGYHHQALELGTADHQDVLIDVHRHRRGATPRIVVHEPLHHCTSAAFPLLGHVPVGISRQSIVLTHALPPQWRISPVCTCRYRSGGDYP